MCFSVTHFHKFLDSAFFYYSGNCSVSNTGEFDLRSMYFNSLLHCMCTWDEPVILTESQSCRDGLRVRFRNVLTENRNQLNIGITGRETHCYRLERAWV